MDTLENEPQENPYEGSLVPHTTVEHPEEEQGWWRRPAGGREVLTVALPLVISSLSWTIMTFVDRVLLKWDSGDAMTAAFAAGTVWFSTLCLPLGIAMYTSTFVSQYFGAGRHERIGLAVWQGVWMALAVSPVILLALPLAPAMFRLADHTPEVMQLELVYFNILCWGGPAMLVGQALSSFYSGRGKTNVVMIVDTSVAVLNLVLDWIWIFGYLGFPAMGIAGAGWATVVSLWVKAVIYLFLILQRQHREQFGTLLGLRFDWPLFVRQIYYGGPSGLQLVLDVLGFTVFIVLIGRLGSVQAEASSMAFSISTLAFMPIWGMSMAASILVGQHLGENRDDLAARATWTAYTFALGYMACISVLYITVPEVFLASFFAGDRTGEAREAVHALSVALLRFVAAYNLLDATLMVFSSAIKGAGDTNFVLRVSLVMATSLSIVSWMAVEWLELGVYGCWAIITLWVWVMGVVFLWRFLGGRWRTMRVIEATPPDLPPGELETEPAVS
ncbi:MATE family efflux transporter [Aeoliella sp.]|uniref:MATE family efflux transporter n=1 Tax=Aeoliella sp. TaxID=2795800 RepID=UPI003CCC1AB7